MTLPVSSSSSLERHRTSPQDEQQSVFGSHEARLWELTKAALILRRTRLSPSSQSEEAGDGEAERKMMRRRMEDRASRGGGDMAS